MPADSALDLGQPRRIHIVGIGGAGAIFRPDAAAMGFDDLFGDR